MYTKRIIDCVVYSTNCKKCEVKPKDDKRKEEGKEYDKGEGGRKGGGIDESEQDDEQIWTSSILRLRSITHINDSTPEDMIIMIEAAQNT